MQGRSVPENVARQEVPLEQASGQPLGGTDVAGVVIRGFFVGSFHYNSRLQLVPEFAGGAPALSAAGATNFRFDKFGIAATKHFADWLTASATVEVERHASRHSHGFDPAFGCPGMGACVESFGSEEGETEVGLDLFDVAATIPVGNGLVLALGRFDLPFGIERHDEPLNVTATSSELYRFGRPQKMTGLTVGYQFSPRWDVTGWVVNRWESETTETPFDDNNTAKSLGGRLGITPFPGRRLLNVGIGGFWGPEREDAGGDARWVIDVDVNAAPIQRLFVAAELAYGGEENVSVRERGVPFAAPAATGLDATWWGLYVTPHYDARDWLGLSFRYGVLEDTDGARTGVRQTLQSWTIAPVLHVSRLIPGLPPTGAAFARTRHPIDWVDLKLEYRVHRSDQSVFSAAGPGESAPPAFQTAQQFQAQLVVNF